MSPLLSTIRRCGVAIVGLAIVAGCSSTASAPTTCPTDELLPTISQYVQGSSFIDTPWEPAPDTDLRAAMSAGGVACSYGIQEAEVGTTILFAQGKDVFESRRQTWKTDGQQSVDIAGTDEAWALYAMNGDERHLWIVNLLVDDVWIQVNATFLSDLDEAQPLIEAAIEVVRG